MLQKFVFWTGAFDFVVGAATWGGSLYDPQPGQFVALMTLGMFLMMAAACLMWASADMVNRYPVMFWQGLVRLTAVSAVIYAVPNGLSQSWEYALVAFDGTIGLTYILGSMRVTGQSFVSCLLCKSASAVASATA
jgi:hypothetical protein